MNAFPQEKKYLILSDGMRKNILLGGNCLTRKDSIYLRLKLKGEETAEYQYMRKGIFPNHNESLETTIHVVYFENGIPVGGHDIANYNSETGEWSDV